MACEGARWASSRVLGEKHARPLPQWPEVWDQAQKKKPNIMITGKVRADWNRLLAEPPPPSPQTPQTGSGSIQLRSTWVRKRKAVQLSNNWQTGQERKPRVLAGQPIFDPFLPILAHSGTFPIKKNLTLQTAGNKKLKSLTAVEEVEGTKSLTQTLIHAHVAKNKRCKLHLPPPTRGTPGRARRSSPAGSSSHDQ